MIEDGVLLENSNIRIECKMEKKEMAWTVFTWAIRNYTRLKEDIVYYRQAVTGPQTWILKLRKTTKILFLSLHSSDAKELVNFTILGQDLKSLNNGIISDFVNGEYVAEFQVDTISSDYLVDDSLIVECKHVAKPMGTVEESYNFEEASEDSEGCVLRNSIKRLLFTGICSDFTVRVGTTNYYLHKAILATRSEYFAKMFAPGAPLANETEMSYDARTFAFREILVYIYAGEFRRMSSEAAQLVLQLAVEFEIKDLVNLCLGSLDSNLSKDNVLGVLTVACKLNFKNLKNKAVRFMSDNCPELMKTDDFKAALKLAKK